VNGVGQGQGRDRGSVSIMREFLHGPVRRAGGNSTDITSPEFRLLLRNNGLNI
jgi:hypothetical protein